MKKGSNKKLSFSEQLAMLASSTPTEFDPEDIQHGEEANAEFDEYDEQIQTGRSKLRKAADLEISLPKYAGKKALRKDLFENGFHDQEEEGDEETEDEDIEDEDGEEENEDEEDEDEEFGQGTSMTNGDDEDEDMTFDYDDLEELKPAGGKQKGKLGSNLLKEVAPKKAAKKQEISENKEEEEEEEQQLSFFSKANDEVEKGKHVKNQLKAWDLFLDCRIRIQKAVNVANRLPSLEGKLSLTRKALKSEALGLVDEFIQLHQELPFSSEVKTSIPKKRSRDEFESDTEYAWHQIDTLNKSFVPFRNEVIDKWNERANSTSATMKKLKVFNQSATKQIEQALQDLDKLVLRAHTLKADLNTLDKGGNTSAGQVNEEIFDDSDFYQQLLREFINSKMSVTDPEDPVAMTRQFLALQQLKQKNKKKVDTKASKGRKIKYELHQKLVNFRVPIPTTAWHEEMISELFNNLFGQKNSNQTTGAAVEDDVVPSEDERIF